LLKLTGGKPKFAQITGGEIFHEGLKSKNLQITRTKTKKNSLQGQKSEMTYIIGGKSLLTLKLSNSNPTWSCRSITGLHDFTVFQFPT